MSWSSHDVLVAYRAAALNGDFSASVGGRMSIGDAPPRAALPYAVLSVIDSVPFLDADADGAAMRVQVTIIVAGDQGQNAASTIASQLRANMSRSSLTVAGLNVLGVDYSIERGPFRESENWRVDADYIIRIREAA